MRILILGPVISEKTSGGVAVFDEGLFRGFKALGDEVNAISIVKSINIDNKVLKMHKSKPFNIVFHFAQISNLIKETKPDLVISSLHYSLGIKKYKRHYGGCKYIHVLHGFPCRINGRLKNWIINKTSRFARRHFDFLVTVSFLSYAINKKINLVECDKVISNGCAIDLINEPCEKIYDFIYIGRLFKDKEVKMIADAFLKLKEENNDISLAICGYGEMEDLFNKPLYKESGINFLGKLSQNEVRNILAKSKFFISMNPLEPFGIVFSEALLSGCNIVTQSTSGCSSLFIKGKYFHIADCTNYIDLSSRLQEIHKEYHEITSEELKYISNVASYKNMALQYRQLLIEKNEN